LRVYQKVLRKNKNEIKLKNYFFNKKNKNKKIIEKLKKGFRKSKVLKNEKNEK